MKFWNHLFTFHVVKFRIQLRGEYAMNHKICHNNIREIRKARGITMKVLGVKVGVAESTISQYETGKRQPDNETLLRLAEALDTTVGYLLGAEIEKAPADESERTVSDDDIKFALFGGDGEITDAMYDEVKRFAQMVKLREENEKKKE